MLKPIGLSLAAACLFGGLTGCAETPRPAAHAAAPSVPVGDTSKTSLDWNGRYRGVVPCADCEGIETVITLKQDGRYVLETRYLGREASARRIDGTFAWNTEGNSITLAGVSDRPAQYLVGENALIQLAMNGERITGELAPKYRLEKVRDDASGDAPALTGKRFRLTELEGQAIPAATDPAKSPYLILLADGNQVNGFGGCNTFGGHFELPAPTRIKFSNMGKTLKACVSGMETEDALLQILEQVDNYALNGNRLALQRARMAPLARFEATARNRRRSPSCAAAVRGANRKVSARNFADGPQNLLAKFGERAQSADLRRQ